MYQVEQLLDFPGLFHAFSTKDDGNMANVILGEDQDLKKVLKNREIFLDEVGADIQKTICMWVVHGDDVVTANPRTAGVSMKDKFRAVKCDALITDKKDLFIFLLIADCLPVIMYDPTKAVIGLAHVGWRGADLKLVKKVIRKLKERYFVNPTDLVIGFGPAAGKKSYIKEKSELFGKTQWKHFLKRMKGDSYAIDFIGLCKRQLQESGVKEENIHDAGIDTVTDLRFFSHYQDAKKKRKDRGRFACIVGLK
jgi:hypothetical protein